MIISRLLGSFCLICFCVGDKRLLIDQLRWDFLELENELWNLSSNGLLYMTREEVEPYLCEKFQDFDKKLMQMPQDLYGSETMRWIPKFSSFQSELKKIETLYQSFRDYQQHVMAESSDGASLEDNIYDIRNNKSGVENSDKKSLEDNIYDIKNNKSGAQNSDKKSLEDNIYDIKNNKSGAENSDKASLEDNIYDIKNNKSGAENSDKASLEDNIYDIKNNKSGAENSDRASLEDNIYDIKNNKSGAEKTVGREYENAYEDYNETLYRKFEDYQQQEMTGSSDIVRLEDIIYDITNNENGAEKTADRVYEIAYKDSDGIQEKLNEQNIDFDCRREQQSPQQPFYNLYNLFAFTDLKAYILQQFSHLVNRLQNKGK
ncbi:unnamed protein product [Ceutorhynchus assimilis]|uniref:Uncharacterized protein n=1 Tax=Ceutorhynchus assimilis TaxID=467358 RepID=A0A9N9MYR4_9CUCU|nr:unnamed protein product [Ceutorhynchus assimilis]